MNPLFITVAPTGAESGKADNPNIPLTAEEIATHAEASEQAGASLIHIHGRDSSGQSSLHPDILTDIVEAVRARTNLIIQLSTGGSVRDSFEDRLGVVDLAPESCSLTCGSVNFGDEIFRNPWPLISELYKKMQALDVLPEFELFDFGHIATLHRLLDTFGPPVGGAIHCNLVLGVPGGMAGTPQILTAARSMLPENATWSATGIGRTSTPVALTAAAMGGHLRVGMEDVLRYSRDELVTDNAQLVARAASIADIAQRPVLTSSQARELLHVNG